MVKEKYQEMIIENVKLTTDEKTLKALLFLTNQIIKAAAIPSTQTRAPESPS